MGFSSEKESRRNQLKGLFINAFKYFNYENTVAYSNKQADSEQNLIRMCDKMAKAVTDVVEEWVRSNKKKVTVKSLSTFQPQSPPNGTYVSSQEETVDSGINF